ncbi:Myotubularin-related protein 8 [Eumeta japonica]|uniref:Myotubularin-related protein 8 n=1 Tax=Eumeta variegata TaxID=151549 RepID=A0A4C1Z2J8_EUMVA|nr:Myotubularin-related protein 8 [Eumeta japonica]
MALSSFAASGVLGELGRLANWLRGDCLASEQYAGLAVTEKLENVQLLDKYNARNPSKGTLYFATTHLIFVDHEMKKETVQSYILSEIHVVERKNSNENSGVKKKIDMADVFVQRSNRIYRAEFLGTTSPKVGIFSELNALQKCPLRRNHDSHWRNGTGH